jgi:DNA end-binding protein Ku
MRSMWKGSVSFGLVTIPIQLYAATENKSVQLRQVHEADGGRIQYKRFCSVEGVEVPYDQIAKGYELDDGEMVVLTDADLEDLPLVSSNAIDVLEFVPLESIDPLHYDRHYYLEPQKAATKPYVLLRDALHKSGHVAIAKVALRQRETLALLRVHGDVLVMTTMSMAGSLIESMSEPVFDPGKYTDRYREALESVIEAKISGGKDMVRPREPAAKSGVVDLMAALEASVSEAKKTRKPPARKSPAKRTTSRRSPKSA